MRIVILLAVFLPLLAVATAARQAPVRPETLGPKVGERVPDFAGVDQDGRQRTLASVMGAQGAMIVFFRSADWCPYCKTQLLELERSLPRLRAQGLGLVAISYDSTETLARFARERAITFPLVSDPGSAIIRRFGLLNTTVERSSRAFGIPFPGTFIVDREGRVKARFFEEAYQERNTVSSILVRRGATPYGPATTITTRHLRLTAAVSDEQVAPGSRVSLVFEVEPLRGMHVYAPGKHGYQVVGASIDPQPWLRVQSMRYPASELYLFAPLDERVEVYQKPFRLTQDLTILATPEARRALEGQKSLTITGRFEYQACDDKLCYTPQSVPVSWTLAVGTLAR